MTRLPLPSVRLLLALSLLTACSDKQNSAQIQVDSLNARALVHLNEGRTKDAIALLDSAIALQPKFAGSYKNRGNAYRRDGDVDGAIRDYSTAISLDGTDGRFFNDRGFAYLRQHKYAPAIQDFDSALKLNPKHALAQQNRGRTHFYLGNLEEAATDLEQALVRDSTNIYVAIWLHFIRGRLGRPNDADFAQHIARMDTVTWPGPVARYYLGRISADELHRLSAGHDSTTTTDQTCAWHFYMGEDQLIKGDKPSAIKNLERAEALCPQRFSEYFGAISELARLRKAEA
jgi:lipoprotein NlpI